MDSERDEMVSLDTVDYGILYQLQLNAREVTHEEISDKVGVSPSTVRNRIRRLEEANVIETYVPRLNYERAGFPLRVQFMCTAPPAIRSQCAQDALEIHGVISIDETITSEQNLCIEVVALDTHDLAVITQQLDELDLVIHSSEIITKTYTQPFTYFERCSEGDQTQSCREGAAETDDE